jgi:DNA-binding NarL/FixJ family response regulator
MPPLLDDCPKLTVEERAALSVAAEGLGDLDVAEAMHVLPEEARALVASAVRKLGARSRLEAVLIADRTGQLDDRP